jgi:predicted HicB family RNase H-like nuclease
MTKVPAPKKEFLSYKGYSGSSEISHEDNCLHGKILFIEDLITYEAQTPSALAVSFREAVDRYLEHCATTGMPANTPHSGVLQA